MVVAGFDNLPLLFNCSGGKNTHLQSSRAQNLLQEVVTLFLLTQGATTLRNKVCALGLPEGVSVQYICLVVLHAGVILLLVGLIFLYVGVIAFLYKVYTGVIVICVADTYLSVTINFLSVS